MAMQYERGELEPPATPVPARTATPRSDYRNSYIQEEGDNRSSYAPEGADYRSSYTPEGGDYRSSYTPPTWESDDREATVISNQAFFDQITAINADIKEINEKIADITALHDTELATIDETERAEIEAETSAQTSELTSMNSAMTQRIKTLASETDLESDNSKHVQLVEKNFKKALQQYHECEVSYMRKMREMLARQYKITNPDATEEEVAEFVETAQTHEQVFVNGVLSSRLTEGRSALREANKRYQNIRKIERDMEQLADLFVELNELVWKQHDQIKEVEDHALDVERNMIEASAHLTKAIHFREAARKKKWWCLIIVIIVIIILIAAIAGSK
ncbi:hypothetical protein H072_11471 [Dactylellina haptotyla CBS 200.50]|uniref:t-SNARE coiled-coil homology domain-containing protein n=1 Tax=Dactylellina haptotyla (strain CBS 200.50) TaxID=1284197 RepID=S8A1P5_DACHA|nr:hypothetical protein H072_11471 [Dactylellina haptotyla CBS 200.50]